MQLVKEYTKSRKYVPNDPIVTVAAVAVAVAVLFVCQFPTASGCAVLQCMMDARSFRGFRLRSKLRTLQG